MSLNHIIAVICGYSNVDNRIITYTTLGTLNFFLSQAVKNHPRI